MKKYKLVAEFPGSPKLGTINTNSQLSWKAEDYPDFWQEVVEKDYEILEYYTPQQYTDQEQDAPDFIKSVKRLSDGEIFTIGDNTKYGCIDKFYIKNDFLLATTVLESIGRYLKDLEKIKQPLFTTEQRSEIEEIIKNIIK